MTQQQQTVEILCPKCKRTEIIHVPTEQLPRCPVCKIQMVIREVLTEGKSY